jgi:tetratricopeptide (TPR) repeat protein
VAQDSPLVYRAWTNASGRRAELAFVAVVDGKLQMQSRAGQEFLLALDQFSETDQKFFCDQQIERAIALNVPGQADEAVAVLTTLITLAPSHAPAFLWLGDIRQQRQEWSPAIDAFKQYAALAPSDVQGPLRLARAYQQQSQRDLAKFWYQKGLELDPLNEEIKRGLDELEGRVAAVVAADPFSEAASSALPPVATAPTAPAPGVAVTPASASEPETAATSFWRQGLVGILGGRSVWWGRLIAIVLHTLGALVGAAQIGGTYRKMFGAQQAPGASFFGGLFGFSFQYIFFWGIPAGWGWALMITVITLGSSLAAGAASVEK